jgi:hypothetical protein
MASLSERLGDIQVASVRNREPSASSAAVRQSTLGKLFSHYLARTKELNVSKHSAERTQNEPIDDRKLSKRARRSRNSGCTFSLRHISQLRPDILLLKYWAY